MARKNVTGTRVELWESYRETIKKDFLKTEKKQTKVEKAPKTTPSEPPKPVITRAEALLNEYEKKKGKVEDTRHGPSPLLVVLAVILFIVIVAGIAFLMEWYYK